MYEPKLICFAGMWLWGKYFAIRQDETGKAIFMV
jgi:hypothetical protein